MGACSDNGGDSRGMRKRLGVKCMHLIVSPCFVHQIVLILGDMYKRKHNQWKELATELLEIIIWFNSHGGALAIFRRHQSTTSEKILALLLPVITRWTSRFCSTNRACLLLPTLQTCVIHHCRELLLCAGPKAHLKAHAEKILDCVDDVK